VHRLSCKNGTCRYQRRAASPRSPTSRSRSRPPRPGVATPARNRWSSTV